ncbi:2,4-dihydroxyhept-2-ene-1,7-dioic acid aldolase [Microbacterium esteraromaticum]|uniref:2,4-dihydroxyhept-2-ene-1,7-dioic acid aldolase n=1 Tax=Microbacterium esteraromaticum TaxID=57043 RepID=A0A1R4J7J8_9MICO|nr:aldolase/citrate lyase family protein [Microbacterium esteraromaticum]SJN28081.1 2,4-dihydroxyhept-2-ene-1,7-dioic acid aldolase [Microbacterium esteraromaticum]
MSLRLAPTFADVLADADRAQVGMWLCTGSPLNAEICAGSGVDWLLIDMEHGPNTLTTVQQQLQVIAAYPVTTVVRVPCNEPVIIKQVLDAGAQNLLVPMVASAEEASAAVAAVRYPPEGVRGVGSALARSGRWGRVEGYLQQASETISLLVQIESADAVEHAAEIAAVDGVDGILIGPADLAASMGLAGQQTHPEVMAAVLRVFAAAQSAGKKVGVNAFDPAAAAHYLAAGADFLSASADVTLLARGAEALAARLIPASDAADADTY